MKQLFLLFTVLLFQLHLIAQTSQTPHTGLWSLRQCIDHAVSNNINLKISDGERKLAEEQVTIAKNSRLPDLTAGASQTLNLGRYSSQATGIYEESSAASSSSVSAGSSIVVFNGFRLQQTIKQSEIDLQQSLESLDKARQNLGLNITLAYLEVLFKKELIKVYQEQAGLSSKQVERTQNLVEAGRFPMGQLFDAKAQLAKDQSSLVSAEQDLALALLNLAQALNIRETVGFDIVSETIPDDLSTSEVIVDAVFDRALLVRPEVKEAQYRIKSKEEGLKIARSYFLPSLGFSVGYNNGYSYVHGQSMNVSFSEQFKNNSRQNLSLNLSIPIFNRFHTRSRVKQAQIAIEQSQYQLANVENELYKEIQQAYQGLQSAQAKFNSSKISLQASQESYAYTDKKYSLGQSTVIEYNEAQNKLIRSKSELLQAKYDYLFRTKIIDFYQGKPLE